MNFKTISLSILIGAMSMGLSSCLGDPENLTTFSTNLANLIVPDDPTLPVTADVNCTYSVRLDGVKNTVIVSTTDFAADGKNAASFSTNEMECLNASSSSFLYGTFLKGSAKLSTGGNVTDVHGYFTSSVFYCEVADDPFPAVYNKTMLVMGFKTPDATVRTFSMNPYFKGETTTTYNLQGEDKTFKTNEAVYRVNFSNDMKTANVAMYNIRFAQEMPITLLGVVIKNIPVKLTREGYVLEITEDVIPEMIADGQLTPYPNYTFNKFRLATTNTELTEASCEYTVNQVFKGSFSGSSCAKVTFQ